MYDTNFVDKIVNHVIGKRANHPLILGIAGSQGSGKSTLSLQTKSRIEDSGIPCVVVCLDDFYYTKATRLELSRSVHSLLSTRGPPGTHDIGKLMDVLDRIRQNTETVTWSTFNKATDDQDPSRMITFTPTPNRATVIILEGWYVGCLPTYTEPAVNELEVVEDPSAIWRHYVNEQIKTKYIPLWNMIDIYMYIAIPDWSFVFRWRQQQSISNKEFSLDLNRFIQFFERITRNMMNISGRIKTDILVRMSPDHSMEDVILQ